MVHCGFELTIECFIAGFVAVYISFLECKRSCYTLQMQGLLPSWTPTWDAVQGNWHKKVDHLLPFAQLSASSNTSVFPVVISTAPDEYQACMEKIVVEWGLQN